MKLAQEAHNLRQKMLPDGGQKSKLQFREELTDSLDSGDEFDAFDPNPESKNTKEDEL